MPCRLRRHDQTPPGGYPYEQTEGIRHKWGFSVDFEGRAREVADFRAGNNLPRASFEEALEDIDVYQGIRLGCMEQWFYNPDAPYSATSTTIRRKASGGGCGGCGAKL
jgi:hypothetical protein